MEEEQQKDTGPPPTEKMIQEWQKKEDKLRLANKKKYDLQQPTA